MHALRHVHLLHRLVLAWFVLSLGVAIAGPVVHPQSMEMVCSAAGMIKLIVHTDEGTQDPGRTAMDCPLCTTTGAPPPIVGALHLPTPLPLAHAVQSIPSARIAAATQAPLPARGPPARS
ncbi:DUF2946 family protein [Variovorax ginsengisoli]|uniref:DUF2946 domain-containing protein n=1 Tax=Variovorax ginsengisoli TaxID=363844 RepID=A0ABT9S4E6_9BURK|nr:DUF2946 family protein [Variovorax ginsengisoli]MDP9898651.1 hypothetical protein [Variovorax ginsengisoli]